MNAPDRLLQLIVPASQATLLSDFLLAQAATPFFTAIEAAGFGQPHEQLDPDEQVAGAQRKVKFEIALAATDVEHLLARLHTTLPSLTIAWRVLPVLDHGTVGRGPAR